jgi:hypothetical protein
MYVDIYVGILYIIYLDNGSTVYYFLISFFINTKPFYTKQIVSSLARFRRL